MLMGCGVQWEFRYVKKVIRPPGIALFRGTGAHAGVEHNMRHKLEHDLDPAPRDEVEDATRDAIANELTKDGVALTEEEAGRGLAVVKNEVIKTAQNLALLHYDRIAPGIIPVAVEREWAVDFESRDALLVGWIDLEVSDGVRDAKTAGKTPPIDAADRSDQLTMYATAYRVLYGRMPATLALDYLIDLKEPKPMTLHTIRSIEDCGRLILRLDAAIRVMETGAFMPCDRSSWMCSPTWCGYHDICPYVDGGGR